MKVDKLAVSSSTPGLFYRVQLEYQCECPGFTYRGRCRHVLEAALEVLDPQHRTHRYPHQTARHREGQHLQPPTSRPNVQTHQTPAERSRPGRVGE